MMHKRSMLFRATALSLAAALVACGDGGSDEASVANPPATRLSIGGTAAVGAALAGAPVSAKCVGGSGSATTGADGRFDLSIDGASLPCVLSVTSGSTTLRSVAEAGSGDRATANITPLSELIVARLAGGDAAALFDAFDAAAQAKLSAAGLSEARAAVAAALQGVIDLSSVDPIKAELKAAHGDNAGNALDQLLDTLGSALQAAGTDLGQVASAMQANSEAPAAVQTLLQPAAPSCAGLRSGKYRLLDAYTGDIGTATALVGIDALKGEYTNAGVTRTFKPSAGEACRFQVDEGWGTAYVAAASGLIVLRYFETATLARTAVLLPEQSVPVRELAGKWNMLVYGAPEEDAGVPWGHAYTTETIAENGKSLEAADCEGAVCTVWTPNHDTFYADAAGGFSVRESETGWVKARLFAYKTAGGKISLLGLMSNVNGEPLGFFAGAKQQALSLPAVGDTSRFWDVELNWSGVASPGDVEMSVTAVDPAAKTLTRKRKSDGRIDSFAVNSPRDGLRYRAAGSSLLDNGTTLNFAESTTMPLPGTGVSVSSGATRNGGSHFTLTVAKP